MKISFKKEFQIAKPQTSRELQNNLNTELQKDEFQPHPNTEGLDFDTFFDRYINECLQPIEYKRQNCIKNRKYSIIAAVVLFLLAFLIPISELKGAALFFIAFGGFAAASIPVSMYRHTVKGKIMNLLLAYLGDFKRVSKSEYSYKDAGEIFAHYSNIAMIRNFNDPPIIDDCIVGTYKGIPVEIEEVKLTETHEKITTKGKETETTTVFKGLIFSFQQIKANPALTITRNRQYGYPQNVGEEVKLEDFEYQRIYKTSSNDQIEARVVLQPAFMERLKELDKKGLKVACCFQDGQVYIAIKTFKDMFEVPLNKSALDKENYRNVITEIESVLSIIDTLKIVR